MATAELETMIVYSVTDAAIAELRAELQGLTADTKEDYELCRRWIATCRGLRGDVEKTRVALKADALAYGKKVDAEAKRITAAIEQIEEPLKVAKEAVDQVERERKAAELKAVTDAQDAAARAERDAEMARLAAERKQLDEQAASQRAEGERLAGERRAVEARQEKLKSLEAAQAKADHLRMHAEREARRAEQAKARAESLKPDREKIQAFACELRSIVFPTVTTPEGLEFVQGLIDTANAMADDCEGF